MDRRLPESLLPGGKVLPMAGNRPLLLRGSTRVWMVEGGRVDVFAVDDDGQEVSGARHHVFRAESGSVLFGVPGGPDPDRPSLLAVGAGGALREFTRDEWHAAAGAATGDLLSGWLRMLMQGIGGDTRLPRKAIEVSEAGGSLELREGDNLQARGGLVWLRVVSGSLRLLGRRDWPEIGAGRTVPLGEGMWFEAAATMSVQVAPAVRMSAAKDFWPVWDPFLGFILDCIRANRSAHVNREHERIRARARLDESLLQRTLDLLGFVFQSKAVRVDARVDREFPLYAAARMAGGVLGIRVEQPGPNRTGRQKEEALQEVARVSRFRTREVVLSDAWWEHDNGPMVAFLREQPEREDGEAAEQPDEDVKQTPVALIPVSPRRYDLWDPVTGERQRVTKPLADRLAARAHSFYRPLPDRKVSGRMLLAHGLRDCGQDLGTMLGLGLLGSLLGLLIPLMTGLVIGVVIPHAERGQLIQIAAILVTCSFATALFNITRGIAQVRIEGRIDGGLQSAICDRLMSLPVPFFQKYTAGDLADRMMGINAIRMILSGVTANTVLMATFASFNLVLLFYYNVFLAMVGVALSAIATGVVVLISVWQVRYQRPMMDLDGRNAGTVLQFITGITKLRVSGTEDRAFAVWARDFAEKVRLAVSAQTLQNVTTTFTAAFPIAATMLIYACMLKSRMELGPFLAFSAAYTVFQTALLQMSTVLVASLDVVPLYHRLRPIIETEPEVHEAKKKPGELSGDIEVVRLDFRYYPGGPMTLKDVSVRVKPGEFVAVVGGSGSGKSTLLRLLLGFEKPESGALYYDGQDLATLDLLEVRRQFGVVLQNGTLMQGDIRSNIMGASNLTLADAWEAARMVGLEEDVRQMPMGMSTLVQAGGIGLSGGQRQRLMIARAIVHRPRILFFDEATSALDNRTQAIVSRSLEGLHVSRVVIAHRLSTILNADRIYVMKDGAIVECGTYDALMGQGGVFHELAMRQIA